MKKICLIFVFVSIFLYSCGESQITQYEFDDYYSELFALDLQPFITGFRGELFGERDVTAGGNYTGFEKLDLFGTLIYCNDDGTIIWGDSEKEAIYRLDSQNKKTKICPHEDCRNDIENICGHVPIYQLIFSDGFLYFAVGRLDKTVHVFRYNVDKYEYEKLMEFENVSFSNLALNSRYLYVQTYNREVHISDMIRPDDRVDLTITRIDLFTETAVVIYSNFSNPDDLDSIGELNDWRFADNRIFMPKITEEKIWVDNDAGWLVLNTDSAISVTTVDMRNIESLIEIEGEKIMLAFGGSLELYDDEIYFTTGESGLSRVDIKTGEREIIHRNILSFSIERNFLYYMLDNVIYQIKLDYTRNLNFQEAIEIYKLEEGYYTGDWKVHGGYLYVDIRTKYEILSANGELPNIGRYKIKVNSQEEPYLLYLK